MVPVYQFMLSMPTSQQSAGKSVTQRFLPSSAAWPTLGSPTVAYSSVVVKSPQAATLPLPTSTCLRRVPTPCAAPETRLARTLSPPPPVPHADDSVGAVSIICGRAFERLRRLGSGSFAVVWEARERADPEGTDGEAEDPVVAIKCSSPANQQMLEACCLEAEVLQQLAAALPAETAAARRVPRYVAHCVRPMARGAKGQVLVAMSKLEGRPLDQWLYGIDENRLKTLPMTELLDGPLPGGQLGTRDLAGATAIAAALTSQMAPVFAALSGIAYHRDVSAHNFLIRIRGGIEEFAILDFGLAVRASTWSHECRNRNISGDPRYFTPAAWMLMVYGQRYLEAHPDPSFLQQYRCRMDHFSFGVLILEVLFALWWGPGAEEAAALSGVQVRVLTQVWMAWRGFWTDSVSFFQTFHAKGAAATQQTLARSQAVSLYVQRLRTLCAELQAAVAHAPLATTAAVFEIAAGLLDPYGTVTWEALPALLARASPVIEERGIEGRGLWCGGTEPHDDSSQVDDEPEEPPESINLSDEPAAQRPSVGVARRFSHRRNWTVDEALTRSLPTVSTGFVTPPTSSEAGASFGNPRPQPRRPLGAMRESL
mmetsp:Transcript_137278/g.382926  ORF Transcript_137278/g.382926 Transcript_137278/m.382926 type:complete len:597 (+) Transcript_137278:86-1876(+)